MKTKSMSHSQNSSVDATLELAIAEHRAGRAAEAERLYSIILQTQPGHPQANHNLGALVAQRGEITRGLHHFKMALEADSNQSIFWLSYARGLLLAGHLDDAVEVLEKGKQHGHSGPAFSALMSEIRAGQSRNTVGSDPDGDYAEAVKFHQAGRIKEAVALYQHVAAARPGHAAVYCNLGNGLASLGRYDQAIAAFRRALDITQDDHDVLLCLGNALTIIGGIDEAVASYRRAIALKPDFAEAHYHLGSVLSENERIAEGFAHFTRRAELVYESGAAPPRTKPDPLHKTKHDQEQRDYLAGGLATDDASAVAAIFRLEEGSRLTGPAVNTANATPEIFERWKSSWPQLVVLDDFLMPEALEKLRRFCAGSTIWRRVYDAGYIGATPEDGFACPLLAQIVEETRDAFSVILGAHKFHYLGAFKYDSELSTGTNTHADNSAVNVNLYITPDDANLDPAGGGMDIWDVAMPIGVDMRIYNGDEAAAREFLKRSNARATTIPHRANRAIIFKSDLFHKTSPFRFKEGYLNKRINVSLLFGQRGAATK